MYAFPPCLCNLSLRICPTSSRSGRTRGDRAPWGAAGLPSIQGWGSVPGSPQPGQAVRLGFGRSDSEKTSPLRFALAFVCIYKGRCAEPQLLGSCRFSALGQFPAPGHTLPLLDQGSVTLLTFARFLLACKSVCKSLRKSAFCDMREKYSFSIVIAFDPFVVFNMWKGGAPPESTPRRSSVPLPPSPPLPRPVVAATAKAAGRGEARSQEQLPALPRGSGGPSHCAVFHCLP